MDESLSLAQAVCGGNTGTMCFALLPQPHSSATHTAILQHRRLVEDKAVAILVCLCTVTITFVQHRANMYKQQEKICFFASSVFNPRAFDVHELSLVFSDNVHGGDKRKTSQQCF